MAANKIKGLTIAISGETTGLDKALSGVNKKSRDLQSELRAVERLLKLDPGNTELLQQKQKLLAESISNTKEKLETLKTAAEQAHEQLAKGDISEEQFRALQREVIKTEESLKKLEKQSEAFGNSLSRKLEAAGKKMQEVGGKITGVGQKLAPVSAAAAAAGAVGVKTFTDFDDAIRQVQATMGAAESEMKLLEDAAKEMGATTRFSASESAEALNYLALAGYDAQTAVETLPKVLQLAAAGSLDLAYASDLVTDSMAALGKNTNELDEFIDKMARTSQKSNTNVAQLGEATLVVAGQANLAKMDITDLNTALGILADNGIKGSEGGTALRNMLKNLMTPTTQGTTALGSLGVAVFDAGGNMRNLQDILQDLDKSLSTLTDEEKAVAMGSIFDSRTIAAANAMLKDSGLRWDELSTSIQDAEGTAKSMADALEGGLGGVFRNLKSSLESVAIAIGETLAPMVAEFAKKLSELAKWFSGLDESQRKFIVKLGLMVAALAPALITIGKLISSIGLITGGLAKLGSFLFGTAESVGALSKAFAFLAANPIALVVAAIAALVAAIVYLWNTNEDFRNAVISAWESIVEAGKAVWDWLSRFFTKGIPHAIQSAIDWFKQLPEKIVEFFSALPERLGYILGTVLATIVKFGYDALSWVGSTVPNIIGNIVNYFATLPGRLWEQLLSALAKIKEWGINIIEWAKTELPNVISTIVSFFMDLPGMLFNIGVDMIKGLWEGIQSMISWLWEKVTGFIDGLVDGIKSKLKIRSPSRVFADIGENMAAGIGVGFVEQMRAVAQMINDAIPVPEVNVSAAGAGGGGLTIHQTNNFGGQYKPRDGAAAVRDLNRKLGKMY